MSSSVDDFILKMRQLIDIERHAEIEEMKCVMFRNTCVDFITVSIRQTHPLLLAVILGALGNRPDFASVCSSSLLICLTLLQCSRCDTVHQICLQRMRLVLNCCIQLEV